MDRYIIGATKYIEMCFIDIDNYIKRFVCIYNMSLMCIMHIVYSYCVYMHSKLALASVSFCGAGVVYVDELLY